ncbi:MAG: helix-turn-helix domain-containing protein [Bryobacterales bacterium]|nr:helix-turn-helix domain-containing protein [Bryobacterales bacterium]
MYQLGPATGIAIGDRLRKARQAAGVTQAQAASTLAVSRPTLIAIEKGTRRAKLDEIESLVNCYGTSVNLLFAHEVPQLDLNVKFRSSAEQPAGAARAVALLNKLGSAMVALERLLGVALRPTPLPEPVVVVGPIQQQAEDAALIARQIVGIGVTPVADVFSLLEGELGFRIFVRKVPSQLSGVFGYDSAAGPCILVNADRPRVRQSLTAVRALGHFLANRDSGGVVGDDQHESTDEERFARAFSYAFLMPAPSVRRRFLELVESNRVFAPRHLVYMARCFHVSAEAMCRRLEKLELLPDGSFDSLMERGGFKTSLIAAQQADHGMHNPHGIRLAQLAASALNRGLLSEGQVSRMLDLDRVEVRRMIEDVFGNAAEDSIDIRLG